MQILLVDKDQDFVDLTSFALRRQGHTVTALLDGCGTVQQVLKAQPELILLGAENGDRGGFAFCADIRERSAVPIILMSPHGDERSLVRGYEAGADDYVVKPFSPRHLLLRIDALARRTRERHYPDVADQHQVLSVGDLVLDPRAFQVRKNGARIAVTRLEFRILSLLMRSAGTLVESTHLIDYAWQSPSQHSPGLLKTHISHIRHKLARAGGVAVPILSIARVGYILSCATEEAVAVTESRLAEPRATAV
jgi:DNA-binding response OmpR family regulator